MKNIRGQFPGSMIIFIPSGGPREQSYVGHDQDMGNIRCIMENAQPGVITTHKRKSYRIMIEAFARSGVCA